MSQSLHTRREVLRLLAHQRSRSGRMRDILRSDAQLMRAHPAQRREITHLALTCVAFRRRAYHLMQPHLKRPKLDPLVLDIITLALVEALIGETPQEIVVSEANENAKRRAPHARSFVNALLRKALPQAVSQDQTLKNDLASLSEIDPERACLYFEELTGLSSWIGKGFVEALGSQDALTWARTCFDPVTAYVVVNPYVRSYNEVIRHFETMGIPYSSSPLPGGLFLDRFSQHIAQDIEQGALIPCDFASHWTVVHALENQPRRIFEIGQGRATKSLLMYAVAYFEGYAPALVSLELHPGKSAGATRRLQQGGCPATHLELVGDARTARALLSEQHYDLMDFDLVFLDAPCSGSGTLRRHPELFEQLSLESVRSAADMQYEILSELTSGEHPEIAYVTCSVFREEQEDLYERLYQEQKRELSRNIARSPLTHKGKPLDIHTLTQIASSVVSS